ncbi:MAG TPA: DUF481 domain-containing protein [Thermoanaerobaculia bacterium]|nr:DUF481 domain-containing protein [Thermoanaerobaculia bacterium]
MTARGCLLVVAISAALAARAGGQSAASPPPPKTPPDASASPAPPAPSKDFIELVNGDRVSGNIRSYKEGRLNVADFSGSDLSIKWNKILSIRSVKEFEVETADGNHHFGSLAASDPPGKLVVVGAGGGTETLDFFDVVGMSPLFEAFFHRIDGTLDLGLNYTHASDLLQFNMSSDAKYRRPKFVVLGDLNLFYTRQNGETQSQRGNLTFNYFQIRPSRWLSGALLSFENNRDLGIQLRSTAGLFVGKFLILQNQKTLAVTTGLLGNHEKGIAGETSNNLEGLVDGRYSTFTYEYPKIWFDAELRVIPGITDAPRFRVDAFVKLKREIVVRDFYLAVSVFYNYDSRPPQGHVAKSDWGPVISIGWTF